MFTGKDTGLVNLIYPEGITKITPNDTWIAGNVLLVFVGKSGINADAVRDVVKAAGGLGIIFSQRTFSALDELNNDFPTIQVDYEIGTKILLYIRSTRYIHI